MYGRWRRSMTDRYVELHAASAFSFLEGAAQPETLVERAVELETWFVAISIVDDLTKSINALYLQAATGLLAIFVLLVVMNWFFHKVYWTGWISLHSRRRQRLLGESSAAKVWLGLALLGFSSVYREGFEVVLFLQSYRLRLGLQPV